MQRKLTALLAWFEPHDAISALLGFRVPDPGEDVSHHVAVFEEKRRALSERPPFVEVPADAEPLPPELAAAGRSMLDAMLVGEPDAERSRYQTVTLDLRRVLGFQKVVTLDRPDPRIASVQPDDTRGLFDICLPSERVEEDLNGTFDKDGKGLTISSPNPNLRLGTVQTIEFPPGSGTRLVGVPIIFGAPYVHVVEYKGRYVLKDGYHRAYALLARGISRVPVILQAARSFSDVHRGGTSLIAPEHLLGTHPPRLLDFHDPTVSATVHQQALRKVVRLRAEEFVINL